MRAFSLLLLLLALEVQAASAETTAPSRSGPQIRIERVPAEDGGELVTIFASRSLRAGEHEGDEKVPLVSILRDTLNHPGSERLRNVWVLTYVRPSLGQKIAAALPFYYSKAGAAKASGNRPPASILDLSAPERGTWTGLIGSAVQSELLDSNGVFFRAPTRGYRANASEYRTMRVAEALQLLSKVGPETVGSDLLSTPEWEEAEARLILSRRMLGGLVSESHLSETAERQDRMLQMNRGHNWELLRQCAEQNGLYFEPLSFGEPSPGHAILWISEGDLARSNKHAFDGAFLKLSNPWADPGLRSWKGYEQTWYFNADGERVESGAARARSERMIPLALYSLGYPPAPLLMVDFRDQWKPTRHEVVGRAADYTVTGLLGFTGYGHWGYMLAKTGWTWLRHRHGANVDRTTRISSYAELRNALFFDEALDPNLRVQIEKRVNHLALNPFERDEKDEISMARTQYAALVAYAHAPGGLGALLARERGLEMVPLVHGPAARTFQTMGTVATLGLYKHREPETPEMLAQLDRQRRLDANVRFLEAVLASSPRIEIAWDSAAIAKRLDEIAEIKPTGRELDSGLAELIGRVFGQTRDDETRRRALVCLAQLNSGGSRRELQRLSKDSSVPTELRTLSASYLGPPAPRSDPVEQTKPVAAGLDD